MWGPRPDTYCTYGEFVRCTDDSGVCIEVSTEYTPGVKKKVRTELYGTYLAVGYYSGHSLTYTCSRPTELLAVEFIWCSVLSN